MWHIMYVEIRGHVAGVISLLLPCGFWKWTQSAAGLAADDLYDGHLAGPWFNVFTVYYPTTFINTYTLNHSYNFIQ